MDLLNAPQPTQLDFLRKWLIRPAMGNGFLKDREKATWSTRNDRDLVSITRRPLGGDWLSSFLGGSLLSLYHLAWGYRERKVYCTDLATFFPALSRT